MSWVRQELWFQVYNSTLPKDKVCQPEDIDRAVKIADKYLAEFINAFSPRSVESISK